MVLATLAAVVPLTPFHDGLIGRIVEVPVLPHGLGHWRIECRAPTPGAEWLRYDSFLYRGGEHCALAPATSADGAYRAVLVGWAVERHAVRHLEAQELAPLLASPEDRIRLQALRLLSVTAPIDASADTSEGEPAVPTAR